MADFFTELEEDLREEKIYTLWKKYGNYVIGLALLIILGTVGHTLWGYFKNKRQAQVYTEYSQAVALVKDGKKDEALKAFQALAKEGGGYGKLSQLHEAALVPQPEEIYKNLSQENVEDPALGNLPKILSASRSLNNMALESLESLTAPNNAWAPLSLELLALADLKRGEDVKAAERYIRILKEPYTTSYEQVRAQMMLSQIDVPPHLLQEALKEEMGQ